MLEWKGLQKGSAGCICGQTRGNAVKAEKCVFCLTERCFGIALGTHPRVYPNLKTPEGCSIVSSLGSFNFSGPGEETTESDRSSKVARKKGILKYTNCSFFTNCKPSATPLLPGAAAGREAALLQGSHGRHHDPRHTLVRRAEVLNRNGVSGQTREKTKRRSGPVGQSQLVGNRLINTPLVDL